MHRGIVSRPDAGNLLLQKVGVGEAFTSLNTRRDMCEDSGFRVLVNCGLPWDVPEFWFPQNQMEATLHSLGGLLLLAVPTIVLVILLHLYLKAVFFGPLKNILNQRNAATRGAREAAEASAKLAAGKTAQYEAALQQARAEMYKEQEEARRNWLADQARLIEEARTHSHQTLHAAKSSIEAEAAAAKQDLEGQSATLAEQISRLVLEGRAS